ncbi:MAG: Nif3-like dinuclear metal center hexameric protein [Bacteroidales bacterium]
MKLIEIIALLEKFAPLSLQETYDNSGLLIGEKDQEISRVLISLDLTEEVMEEAIAKKCNLIISHHPVIFKGLKSITDKNSTERIIKTAIKKDIALYAIHTNLDNIEFGVNDILCKKLGISNAKILSSKGNLLRKLVTFCPTNEAERVREAIFKAGAGNIGNYDKCSFNLEGTGSFRGSEETNPFVGNKGELHYEKEIRIETIFPVYMETTIIKALFEAHPYEEVAYDIYSLNNQSNQIGAGKIGELENAMDAKDFLLMVKKITGTGCIRHSPFVNRKIKRVVVCGGSGSFLTKDAIRAGADVFLTGDVKYHDFFEADKKIIIADIGHYESEQFAKELIYSVLKENFSNFAVLISETNTNSVNYL